MNEPSETQIDNELASSASKELALPAESCPNCHSALIGPYCANCGQQQIETKNLLVTFLNEAFDDVFSFSSRAWKTTFALFFKPGFLSTEYSAGRRKRYIQPLRLYLICSIVFFLVLSFANFIDRDNDLVFEDTPASSEAEQNTEPRLDQTPDLDITATPPATAEAAGLDIPPSVEPSEAEARAIARERLKKRLESDEDFLSIEWGEDTLPLLDEDQSEKFKSIVDRQLSKAKKIAQDDPRELLSQAIDIAPPVAFVLLPIFAFVMMLFYPFKRKYYAEHLVLAVHNHCFVFACLTLNLVLPLVSLNFISSTLDALIFIWMPIYMYLSLLRVHQQGKLLTGIKYIALFSIYFMLLGAGAMFAAFVGLLVL